MKNKHGFTLIELLAVIVLLAIIVLIATPLVIEVSRNRPSGGTIIVKDGEVQANSTMSIGDYSIVYSDGKNENTISTTVVYNLE